MKISIVIAEGIKQTLPLAEQKKVYAQLKNHRVSLFRRLIDKIRVCITNDNKS